MTHPYIDLLSGLKMRTCQENTRDDSINIDHSFIYQKELLHQSHYKYDAVQDNKCCLINYSLIMHVVHPTSSTIICSVYFRLIVCGCGWRIWAAPLCLLHCHSAVSRCSVTMSLFGRRAWERWLWRLSPGARYEKGECDRQYGRKGLQKY